MLAELDYFVASSLGVGASLELLQQVAASVYGLAAFGAEDISRAARVIERYTDLGIGLTDASIVVLADRHDTDRVFTLDERHFRALRTLDGRPFTVLPADA